ncbi:ABC transporter ATP-binding protein [Pantoea ananatis]
MSSDIIVSAVNLRKVYQIYSSPMQRLGSLLGLPKARGKEFVALESTNFEIKRGETVGIIGVNGSGKSTLLQMICGTLSPTSGKVMTKGRIAPLLELGAGFNPEFTGRENVYLNASLLGLTRKEINERFDNIAAFADIGEFLERPVKTYSSGMFARLAFATAVHVEPDILIVDEILAVGDSRFQRKCVKKFNDIRNDGCTILFVSHDDYQVRNICNSALYLEKGVQRYFGNADIAVQHYLSDLQKNTTNGDNIAFKKEKEKEVCQKLIVIDDVYLRNSDGKLITEITSGENVQLSFDCTFDSDINEFEGLSFVFNLYRKDGVYICGTTTAMRGLGPYQVGKKFKVTVDFPSLKLLSGVYNWRVAVNDKDGIQIITEALPVCEFFVADEFRAVGIYEIEHSWKVEERI